MASTEALAGRTHHAHSRALEVISEHASAERVENLGRLGTPSIKDPARMAAIQQEQIAALAEMYEELASRQAAPSKKK